MRLVLQLKGAWTGSLFNAELRDAYDAVVDNATRFTAEGSLDGVLVQQMISDAVAETIVGVIVDPGFGPAIVLVDPGFGPAIVFGLGGTFVELFKDRALGIPPFTEEEAKELIAQTRVSRLLRGFRDRPLGDEQALVRTLIQVGRFALDWQDRIHTVDINPITT